jgi:hypothetical protein
VKSSALRSVALALPILLTAATPARAPIGYVDLPRLILSHPLHAVLLQYDREIAALRSTQEIPGLSDAAAAAGLGAAALQRDAATAQSHARQIASGGAAGDSARERAALATVLSSPRADTEMSGYTNALMRETNANLTAFERAITERTERAFTARQQQLREKELTLAFDLARADAGKRLSLTLKLEDLHLTPTTRAKLRAALAALDERELKAVTALRRDDAEALAEFRRQLQREGESADAEMAGQLRAKAGANFALRQRVPLGQSGLATVLPNLPSRVAAFSASYNAGASVAAIAGGLSTASSDLSQRFARLGESARRSDRETIVQIQALQAARDAVYRSIVAQIFREARLLVRERHLGGLEASSPRPQASVDLTPAVRARL